MQIGLGMMNNRQDEPATGPAVVVLADDLFFVTRLTDVIRQVGGCPIVVENADELVAAVDLHFPVLVLLDLKTPGDWETAIQRCKLSPQNRQIPLYAFGSHVDTETLRRARQAGADHAWARSKMMEELVAVVQRYVHPPAREVEGSGDPLSRAAVAGLLEFNRRDFFEQHEYLELAWNEESRPVREMYQGILQVGVAFLQIERGNWRGALKLFRRGLPRLRELPAVCQGVDVAGFRTAAESIHAEVTALGPERLSEFNRSRFPLIHFENPYGVEEIEALGVNLPD
jgi:CheY-like chemotaxis protein